MKKSNTLSFLVVLILLLSNDFPSQNFWQPMGDPLGSRLSQLQVLNDQAVYVYAATYQNEYFHRSFDSGITWDIFGLYLGWDVILDQAGYYYMVDDAGRVYRSINNGINWTIVYNDPYIEGGSELENDTNGGIYLYNRSSSNPKTIIEKSNDFGNNWNEIYSTDEGSNIYYTFEMTNQGHLYLQLNRLIVRTTDYGNSFEEFHFPDMHITSFTECPNGYLFATNIISDTTKVIRSTDDGLTWQEISQINGAVNKIYAASNDQLFGCIYGDGVLRSTDYGLTWEFINQGLANYDNRDIVEDFMGYLYVTTDFDGVFRSINPITGISNKVINSVSKFYLDQNYPNPFNPSTIIKYSVPQSSQVIVKVFDVWEMN